MTHITDDILYDIHQRGRKQKALSTYIRQAINTCQSQSDWELGVCDACASVNTEEVNTSGDEKCSRCGKTESAYYVLRERDIKSVLLESIDRHSPRGISDAVNAQVEMSLEELCSECVNTFLTDDCGKNPSKNQHIPTLSGQIIEFP